MMVEPALLPCECDRCTDSRRPSRAPFFVKFGCIGALAWQLPTLIALVHGWVR